MVLSMNLYLSHITYYYLMKIETRTIIYFNTNRLYNSEFREDIIMTTILLTIIYIACIGLGIPDSLLGTAWPAIYREFGLPISSVSYISLLISVGTVISSLLSARVINKFGTGKVAAVSTSMTAIALLGFSFSNNLLWLCLSAIPLGLGAGAIDTAMNNYVALHYTSKHMNFLHCFYGIGVSFSPYLMSMALSNQSDWRNGYQTVFYFQLLISVICIIALPLWNKVKESTHVQEENTRTMTLSELIKMPSVRFVWGAFIGLGAMESLCAVWTSTFLVNVKGITSYNASKVIMIYYIGMTLGRFLSGILADKLSNWTLIKIGQLITISAILLLILPLSLESSILGLFLIGLGISPIFPNLIHLTPKNFGKDISQSVMGTQIAAFYVATILTPPFFGLIAELFGVNLFPFTLFISFIVVLFSIIFLTRELKKSK